MRPAGGEAAWGLGGPREEGGTVMQVEEEALLGSAPCRGSEHGLGRVCMVTSADRQ